MKINKNIHLLKIILSIAVAILLFFFQYHLYLKYKSPKLTISKQATALNYQSEFLRIASMGNERAITGLLWMQTLLEGDLEHYKKRDSNSWMFLRFKSIVDLDPNFYEAYLYGGLYLSVIKDDLIGAKKLFDLGLPRFKHKFWFVFYMAYHYYFELLDEAKGLELYTILNRHPLSYRVAPYISGIIARVKAQNGKLEDAYTIIEHAYMQAPPESPIAKQFAKDLYAIKAELDLNCLNGSINKVNCSKVDFFNKPYLKNQTGYYAQLKWSPYRERARHKRDQRKLPKK